MIKEELLRRSPIRLLEKSIQGGLAAGEMGIVASQRGVGKTSVLVQIALDRLLQGRKVIHVSFVQHRQNVLIWYDDIFEEFTSRKDIDGKGELRDEVAKNRVLMNFSQASMSLDMVVKSLRAMIVDGGFAADTMIVDGFNFADADRAYVSSLKDFAREAGLSIWCNCTVNGEGPRYDESGFPMVARDFADLVDVAIVLEPRSDHVELLVSKNRGAACGSVARLDPKTLMILQ